MRLGLNADFSRANSSRLLTGLDNLPSEISFLLTEIQHIDVRSQGTSQINLLAPTGFPKLFTELQQEAAKEASRYIRHSGRSTPGAPPNPKDAAIHETVKEYYAQIEQLADEKLVLAQRVVDLISRARAKLDHELLRVLVQQGDDPNVVATPSASTVSFPRRNALQEIKETLRTPRETTPVVSAVPTPTQVASNKSEVFSHRSSYPFANTMRRETDRGWYHDRFYRIWQPCAFHGVHRNGNSAINPARCPRL